MELAFSQENRDLLNLLTRYDQVSVSDCIFQGSDDFPSLDPNRKGSSFNAQNEKYAMSYQIFKLVELSDKNDPQYKEEIHDIVTGLKKSLDIISLRSETKHYAGIVIPSMVQQAIDRMFPKQLQNTMLNACFSG